MSSSGFGGFPVSPTKNQALLSAGDTYVLDMKFAIHSAKNLMAAAQDGLTSNCQCECFLQMKNTKTTSPFKSKVAKSTRNPIWNMEVDFGRVDLKDVDGLKLVVKHVSGFTSKNMGEAFIPVEFFYEMDLDQDGGAMFTLEPLPDMPRRPGYGEVRLLFQTKKTNSSQQQATQATPPPAPVLHLPLAELNAVKACHRAIPKVGEKWYAVASIWIEQWLVFVANQKHTTNNAPGPIPNHFLLDSSTGQVRQNLRLKQDYRLIDEASWQLYLSWYSGGPTISIVVPHECFISLFVCILTMVDGNNGLIFSAIPPRTSVSSSSSISSSSSNNILPAISSIRSSSKHHQGIQSALVLGSLKARKKKMKHDGHKQRDTPLEEEERQIDGIVYQSRIKIPHSWNFTNAKERWQAAVARSSDDVPNRRPSMGDFLHISHGRAGTYQPQNAEARARCAESLYKLSKQVGSELMIIESGAIQNIADFCDVEDTNLQAHSAATLANLTSTTSKEVLGAFVARDGIPVVLEVSWSPSFPVKVFCTTTLCRLSVYLEFSKNLFASKAVIELSNMLSLPHPPLQKLCIQTLVNMICHGCEFHEKLYCGGGNVGHNKLGIVLALSQLAQEPSNGRYVAKVIYNLSLFPSSAAGAIRGGIGEVLYYLIQAPHSTHSLAKIYLNQPSDSTVQFDQLAVSQLIAMALGHLSKYLDLQLIMGSWSIKVVQHFLFLYDTVRSTELHFVLQHCARVLANLSANDEYIDTVLRGNQALIQKLVEMYAWATKQDDIECRQNVLRSMANLARCPVCSSHLVQASVIPVLNQVLLLETGEHVVPMKEDALVALVNIACHNAIPDSFFDLRLVESLKESFYMHVDDMRLRFIISLTICYLTYDVRLRPLVINHPELLIDALHFGFHYPVTVGAEPYEVLDRTKAHDPFDDMSDSHGVRFRFLAAMCYIAGDIHTIDHVQALVDVVIACSEGESVCSVEYTQKFGIGAVEYFCAGIMFALSKTTLMLLRNHNRIAEWTSNLFAPRAQEAVFWLSRFASSHILASSPRDSSPIVNLQGATQAFCTGTLYHMCAAKRTTAAALLALVDACNASEDQATLLACASTFAIVSFTPEGRQLLLTTNGLAHALNKLGRASMCQQYAAVAACNVAITGCMWNAEELKDFIVVALLRSNSFDAIQVHAKTLYNLLSHPSSRAQVINDGVLYAFLKLVQLQTNGLHGPEETLSLCVHALFNLSDSAIYHDTILKLGVTSFLLSGVSGRRKRVLHFLNLQSRRYAVGLLCNLSAREANHKELIQSGQVIDIMRSLCDGDTETRASAAMTIRNLTLRISNAEVVCTRNALNLLLVFLSSSHDTVRRLAAQAIGNCSLVTELLHLFLELKVGDALIQVLENSTARLEDDTVRAVLKALHNLAIDDACAMDILHYKLLARWSSITCHFQDLEACGLAASTCQILSRKPHSAQLIANQNIVALCRHLSECTTTHAILLDCLRCLVNLSAHISTHLVLFETNVVEMLCQLLGRIKVLPQEKDVSPAELYICAAMLFRNLSVSVVVPDSPFGTQSSTVSAHQDSHHHLENMLACEQLMLGAPWLCHLVHDYESTDYCPEICVQVCVTLANLCKIRRLRCSLVTAGLLHLLLHINRSFESSPMHVFLQQSSTVTLHHLAAEDSVAVEAGLIEALLSVLDHSDVDVHEVQHEESKVARIQEQFHDEPLSTTDSLCRQTYREVRWVNYIVEAPSQLDPSFDGKPKLLQMARIRGPLRALQDAQDHSSTTPICHILHMNTEKIHLDQRVAHEGVVILSNETPPPTPGSSDSKPDSSSNQGFLQIKKFDHHMKITRKQSRRGYLGSSSLPHLKSELQVEK